jgi:N-acetyl-anhydromuramyl-L-alanine amidase AmpD
MVRVLIYSTLLLAAGCSSMQLIDVPSENHNSRIQYLVIHFTSENFAESLRLLTRRTDNPVSVHYLVPEPGDDTYDRPSLRIHRLVPESRRAWHAGRSFWAGADALNDTSVGIEIVNQSACVDNDPETESPTPEDQTCRFLDYPEEQLALVIELAQDILERNPEIDPVDVIGHGDIAAGRRVDPGPHFPWKRLYANGIGAWYDDETVAMYREQFDQEAPDLASIQAALGKYGYLIEETGKNDTQTRFVMRSFQMHFRPSDASGEIDAETAAILFALNDKYRSNLPQNSFGQRHKLLRSRTDD